MLAALLAIAWQSFVTQAHVHPDAAGAASSIAPGDGPTRVKADAPPSETPSTCPICQELAHAGRYLSPGPVIWQAPAASAFRPIAPFLLMRDGHGRSHAWRSRGPPALFQA